MAKLSLGSAPASFKRNITIELLDGNSADIEMTFKYRTRKEYAKLLDEMMKTETSAEGAEVKTETASEIFTKLGDGTADFILKIANGWDLDDKFNKSNVSDLVDKFPSAANAISEAYRLAILEGRTKN